MAASEGDLRARISVDPHNYTVPDSFIHGRHTRIGEGCYRTRALISQNEGHLNQWDVVQVADEAIRTWARR